MPAGFVHLKVRTEFSLVDSIVRIKDLVSELGNADMPACAITDLHNYFGLIKFYKATQSKGIKPICACDFHLVAGAEGDKPSLISLYAMNEQGYKNITRLISLSWQDGQKFGEPYIQPEWLEGCADGVIALSGGKFGDVGQQLLGGHKQEAERLLKHWMAIFPDRFYLELQRTARENDERYLHLALELAQEMDCPLVATNDVRFISAD